MLIQRDADCCYPSDVCGMYVGHAFDLHASIVQFNPYSRCTSLVLVRIYSSDRCYTMSDMIVVIVLAMHVHMMYKCTHKICLCHVRHHACGMYVGHAFDLHSATVCRTTMSQNMAYGCARNGMWNRECAERTGMCNHECAERTVQRATFSIECSQSAGEATVIKAQQGPPLPDEPLPSAFAQASIFRIGSVNNNAVGNASRILWPTADELNHDSAFAAAADPRILAMRKHFREAERKQAVLRNLQDAMSIFRHCNAAALMSSKSQIPAKAGSWNDRRGRTHAEINPVPRDGHGCN